MKTTLKNHDVEQTTKSINHKEIRSRSAFLQRHASSHLHAVPDPKKLHVNLRATAHGTCISYCFCVRHHDQDNVWKSRFLTQSSRQSGQGCWQAALKSYQFKAKFHFFFLIVLFVSFCCFGFWFVWFGLADRNSLCRPGWCARTCLVFI